MTAPAALVALLIAQGAGRAPFIGEFPVEDLASRKAGPSSALTLTVRPASEAVRSSELGRRFELRASEGGALSFDVHGYPASTDPVLPAHSQPSFVIDYDEKPVQALRARLVARGQSPSMEEVTEFVDKAIPKKNMQRAFDFASVVARRGEGDCTEHAVLLAALARSVGIPARVVLGLALVETPEGLRAFGHAWVEYAQGGSWRPADAALRGVSDVQYLPLTVMVDETASHLGALMRTGTLFAVQSLRVEDTPKR